MSSEIQLKCKECSRTYPTKALHVCEYCFGPLEVEYDYDGLKETISREKIESGPRSIWRYLDLLPVKAISPFDLGVGFTPLVKADRLGEVIGLNDLWIKDDTRNPTGSFKDRVVAVAITRAQELGFKVSACASTGNLANATAALSAKAQMESFIFIPSNLEKAKIVNSAIYGVNVVGVDGNYDDVNRLCAELTSYYPELAFVNVNLRPYYAEGSKTLAFETAEQLGWTFPDHVVVPIASGSQLTKIYKGFNELSYLKLVEGAANVRISGAQASGCSPVANAFKSNAKGIKPVKPNTIAKSLAIGDPADGYYALDVVRKTNGAIEDASDEEIVEAIKLLAKTEAIFAETAGGVTIASLIKLVKNGVINKDEKVVAFVTGHGLKTIEALGDKIGPTNIIKPSIEVFRQIYGREVGIG